MRSIALTILLKILYEDQFSHLVLQNELKKHPDIQSVDKRFIEHLVRGTVERKVTLEAVINRVSSTKVKKMKPVIACILLMGAYQILFMDTEDYAAVNESVKLAVKRGFSGLRGFVNGVLRKISSEGKAVLASLAPYEKAAMPKALYEQFVHWYDEDQAQEMCQAFLSEESKRLCIRRNVSKISEELFFERLTEEGMEIQKTFITDDTYFVKNSGDLSKSESFNQGLFYVQDVSSALAGDIIKDLLHGNISVLDTCAAPGGKTIHAADLLHGEGHIVACDVSEKKVEMIRENIERSGFENIETCVQDATVFHSAFQAKFDVVLLDAPCSGLGIIAAKPDIRFHVTEESLESIVKLQKQIFQNVFQYLKENGTMVYSTCTVNPKENGDLLREMQKICDFRIEEEKQLLPSSEYPGTGFFIARLKKA